MRMEANLSILFFFIYSISIAQTTCPCCTEQHDAFDFWEGDWIVYDTLGNQIGENTITSLENNCILNEHWRGAQGSTGRSYNYYDNTDSTWNQLWIDNGGNNLKLKGHAANNVMVMKSGLIQGRSSMYANRITWTLLDDKSVRQVWEIIDADGQVLSTAFYGIYKKRIDK